MFRHLSEKQTKTSFKARGAAKLWAMGGERWGSRSDSNMRRRTLIGYPYWWSFTTVGLLARISYSMTSPLLRPTAIVKPSVKEMEKTM